MKKILDSLTEEDVRLFLNSKAYTFMTEYLLERQEELKKQAINEVKADNIFRCQSS